MSYLKESEHSPNQFELVHHIRAEELSSNWIDRLGEVFYLYSWDKGYGGKSPQGATYLTYQSKRFEEPDGFILHISKGIPSVAPGFGVNLKMQYQRKPSQYINIYGSGFASIDIIKDNEDDIKFARFSITNGEVLFDVYPDGKYSFRQSS